MVQLKHKDGNGSLRLLNSTFSVYIGATNIFPMIWIYNFEQVNWTGLFVILVYMFGENITGSMSLPFEPWLLPKCYTILNKKLNFSEPASIIGDNNAPRDSNNS